MADVNEFCHVEIGFLEKCEAWKLESRFFPSKVGGKPAWLDLENISVDLQCELCCQSTIFLCQLYAPIVELDRCFHRMLFVFICPNPECCKTDSSRNFKVYRCQLSQDNPYFAATEPVLEAKWSSDARVEKYRKTCAVCGAAAPHRCAKCTANYCSREHQVLHWRSGHKQHCGEQDILVTTSILFPEFEILTEPEDNDASDDELKEDTKEDEKYKKYEEALMKEGKAGALKDVTEDVLDQLAHSSQDKYFKEFRKRLSLCPDQVVRFQRRGQPLWVSKPPDTADSAWSVPPCEYCNAERQFEFQIVSTLLNYLNVDSLEKSIDWGTLVIYTCAENCDGGPAYKKEFLYKQDIQN